jgi:type II secretory pathway component PulF
MHHLVLDRFLNQTEMILERTIIEDMVILTEEVANVVAMLRRATMYVEEEVEAEINLITQAKIDPLPMVIVEMNGKAFPI